MVKENHQAADQRHDKLAGIKDLVLHNDDFNTFDHVIASLIEVCKHELLQAEQCALLTHYKGKCTVKSAVPEELRPMHEELRRRGLTTTID